MRIGAAAAVAAGVLVGCSGRSGDRAAPPAAPRTVQLAAAQAIAVPETIAVTGTLAPREELVLGFQVAGRLAQLDVDVGDQVTEGQTIAVLEPTDFALGVERARAALASARARLGLVGDDGGGKIEVEDVAAVREAQAVLADTEVTRQRLDELVRQNLRSQADLDAAVAAVAVAKSRLQAARDQVRTWIAECGERTVDLELAQKRSADARLLAPWRGSVAARTAAPGRYVQVGEAVLTLLRVDPLRLRMRVPERLCGRAAVGQQVEFTVDGAGDTLHTGKVARLGAAIDRDDRTLLVEAEVANADGALRTGAFCRARIVVAEARAALAVPFAAVQSFAGVDRVFVVDGGKAKEVLVELGARQGDLVEAQGGLQPGQQVIADPRGLVQGAPVTTGG